MADTPSKKAFPLRIPKKLFEQIRVWADQDLRSINGQIEFLLADAVRRHHRSVTTDESSNSAESTDDATG